MKEEGMLRPEDVPLELLNRFSQDLKEGKVASNIKEKKDRIYSFLAHQPGTLSKIAYDAVKDSKPSEELSKILWLIGDYLIDEINSAKEEEINLRVMHELKEQLLGLWEDKQDKERWQKETHKAFESINSCLQIKGLLLLYKKHKKEVETAAEKIAKIVKSLPRQSQLYLKAKEELRKTGTPIIDPILFQPEELTPPNTPGNPAT